MFRSRGSIDSTCFGWTRSARTLSASAVIGALAAGIALPMRSPMRFQNGEELRAPAFLTADRDVQRVALARPSARSRAGVEVLLHARRPRRRP